MSQPRYPDVVVQLSGQDGNAFAVMGAVTKALRRAGVELVERRKYMNEAMSGSYDELLATTAQWVTIK